MTTIHNNKQPLEINLRTSPLQNTQDHVSSIGSALSILATLKKGEKIYSEKIDTITIFKGKKLTHIYEENFQSKSFFRKKDRFNEYGDVINALTKLQTKLTKKIQLMEDPNLEQIEGLIECINIASEEGLRNLVRSYNKKNQEEIKIFVDGFVRKIHDELLKLQTKAIDQIDPSKLVIKDYEQLRAIMVTSIEINQISDDIQSIINNFEGFYRKKLITENEYYELCSFIKIHKIIKDQIIKLNNGINVKENYMIIDTNILSEIFSFSFDNLRTELRNVYYTVVEPYKNSKKNSNTYNAMSQITDCYRHINEYIISFEIFLPEVKKLIR